MKCILRVLATSVVFALAACAQPGALRKGYIPIAKETFPPSAAVVAREIYADQIEQYADGEFKGATVLGKALLNVRKIDREAIEILGRELGATHALYWTVQGAPIFKDVGSEKDPLGNDFGWRRSMKIETLDLHVVYFRRVP